MKLKDPEHYYSKKRQVDLIEQKLISNAHSYGWSKVITSRAIQEGLLKVRIRYKPSKQVDIYRLIFALSYSESDLIVKDPVAYDLDFLQRFKDTNS